VLKRRFSPARTRARAHILSTDAMRRGLSGSLLGNSHRIAMGLPELPQFREQFGGQSDPVGDVENRENTKGRKHDSSCHQQFRACKTWLGDVDTISLSVIIGQRNCHCDT
jgi:hypothetical protein